MIPLILLALGLGAALTFSSAARSGVDAFVRAIRSADTAHQAADAHLGNVNAAAAAAVRHTQKAAAKAVQRPSAPSTTPTVQWVPAGPVQWVPAGPIQWVPPSTAAQPVAPSVQPTADEPTPTPVPSPDPIAPPPTMPSTPLPDPDTGAAEVATEAAVEHAASAIEANQEAAKNTADAARLAQDEMQRRAAADSAAKVLERDRKIAAELRSLGIGQCGVRTYKRITERSKNLLLVKLRDDGMGVTGNNPWNIDTHKYGVKLRAVWDPKAAIVKLIVTTGKGTAVLGGLHHVTCQDVWDEIDPIMKEVANG